MAGILKFISIVVLMTGCAGFQSLEDFTRAEMGRPISEIAAMDRQPTSYASSISWKEITYQLENGDFVFIHPYGPRNFIHWEVNPQGIIVGYAIETVGRGETTKGKDFKGGFRCLRQTSKEQSDNEAASDRDEKFSLCRRGDVFEKMG
ncbi:MAG: hypothetical protein ABFD97_14800 [Syntrophobacter sp.]